MNLTEVINKLVDDVLMFNQIVKSNTIITFRETYRGYQFTHEKMECFVLYSVYTLRILNYKNLPDQIARTIRLKIRDKKLLRDTAFVERNAFIDFIRLWKDKQWDSIQFIDREKPSELI